jgi:hypothetical protein
MSKDVRAARAWRSVCLCAAVALAWLTAAGALRAQDTGPPGTFVGDTAGMSWIAPNQFPGVHLCLGQLNEWLGLPGKAQLHYQLVQDGQPDSGLGLLAARRLKRLRELRFLELPSGWVVSADLPYASRDLDIPLNESTDQWDALAPRRPTKTSDWLDFWDPRYGSTWVESISASELNHIHPRVPAEDLPQRTPGCSSPRPLSGGILGGGEELDTFLMIPVKQSKFELKQFEFEINF